MKIDPKQEEMSKEELEYFEQYSLEPFECSVCKSRACKVVPIMPQLSEDDTAGLLVNCFYCNDQIACVPITAIGYEMLLRGEMESNHSSTEEMKD
jgi:hypothetical protein